jgi:hypothetical protein
MIERAGRRMPLRELLTHAQKCARDLIVAYRADLGVRLSDFRDLSRPVRRRSSYPTLVALQNALDQLQEAMEEAAQLAEHLHEQLEEIRERAKGEQANRL